MFQWSTVRPHPHCLCAVHIPWAISPRSTIVISAFRTGVLIPLARLAQSTASQSRKRVLGVPFPAGARSILRTFSTIVTPLSSPLSVFLIISASCRPKFDFCSAFIGVCATEHVSGSPCPDQAYPARVPRGAHSCTPDWSAAAPALPTFLSLSGI